MAELEKVIKGLEICIRVHDNEKCPDECPYRKDICYGTVGLMADALSLLKAQKPGWISVKDRLPEKNTPVLWYVVLKDRGMGHCRLGTFDGAVNHEVPSVSCCGPNAIPKFWMPLPEPPKEDK